MQSGGFTDRAKAALSLAEKMASRMSAGYVGTEHILVGLLREKEGVAARVLKGNGADEEKIVEMIQELIMPEVTVALRERQGYSPRAKFVLEEAHRQADLSGVLRHNFKRLSGNVLSKQSSFHTFLSFSDNKNPSPQAWNSALCLFLSSLL